MTRFWPVGPVPAVIGAAIGGALGYAAFWFLAERGLYAMVLPGALLGLGCGFGLGRRSIPAGVICGVLGLALGLFTEWRFAPFKDDDSLGYFIAHLGTLQQRTWLTVGCGALFGGWFGQGRQSRTPSPS